jgi:sugar phosphate isomerase/epimerase
VADAVDIDRLSLNLMTVERWSLDDALEGCRRAGISAVGVWRQQLGADSGRRLADSGLEVSGLCRGGFFPAATGRERRQRQDENRRAISEAAEIGSRVLVLVCGPPSDRDLDTARRLVTDGIAELVPCALEHGVTLGVEPLHPMMIGERSVIVTLGQALDIALQFDPAAVGVLVDAYHVFWDPALDSELSRARGRIVGFHVSDWLVPTTSTTAGRGMMGDGIIDLRRIRLAVEAAGYSGAIEVEIINPALAQAEPHELVRAVCERFRKYV